MFLRARSRAGLCALAALTACGPDPPAEGGAGEMRSGLAAAAGVVRADSGSGREFRTVPLRPLTGDAEIEHGDPEREGEPFVMRIRELPGTVIPPHRHPVDEHLTVLQGSLRFGVGERFDSTALRELGPGSYTFIPAGTTMFGYAPEPAVVQVHGVGPFHITWRDGLAVQGEPGTDSVFHFRRGEAVVGPRGPGRVRQGYASGDLVQYVVDGADGSEYMAHQHDLRRP